MNNVEYTQIRDFKEFFLFYSEYIGENDMLDKWYAKYPELFIGCYSNGNFVGFICGRFEGCTAIIEAIAVKKEFWGRGIGKTLLKKFEDVVKKKGIKILSVGSAKNVDGFYKKCGFIEKERKKDYVVMEKRLEK
jgi:GNAT superfamily N-acetyltransferase